MPKKSMRSRSRSRKGGMWPFDSTAQGSSSTGSWYDSLNPFGEKKQPGTGISGTGFTEYGSTSNGMGMGYSQQPSNTGYGYGGKKGKRRRSMRGGDVSAYTPIGDSASAAASVSGIPTASASYVGGRTRRRRNSKSCKKSCKKSCRKH